MEKKYVQYGCGLCAPPGWINFDASPTLRIQRIPLLNVLLKNKLNAHFPRNVKYGNIIKGLPVKDHTCDGVYCSHTLEHLSLHDLRIALENSFRLLKKGGIFRMVVPDLEYMARQYISSLEKGDQFASIHFMNSTMLGLAKRPKSIKEILGYTFGNSHHLWMWDSRSLMQELSNTGFTQMRPCRFHDCADPMFNQVEDADRFEHAVAIECIR